MEKSLERTLGCGMRRECSLVRRAPAFFGHLKTQILTSVANGGVTRPKLRAESPLCFSMKWVLEVETWRPSASSARHNLR